VGEGGFDGGGGERMRRRSSAFLLFLSLSVCGGSIQNKIVGEKRRKILSDLLFS
jgi:ABC-type Na+ efflux pump permease subunit